MARWAWVAVGMVVVVVGGLVLFGHLVQQQERHIRVGRDTTFVSGPVDAWGYVDYVAGANAEFSAGVTGANNAAGLLVRATGVSKEVPGRRAAVLKGLGLKEEEVPEKGYMPLGDVMAERKGEASWAWKDRVSDEEDLLRKKAWRAEENPDGAAWVKGNAPALELVKAASVRARYFEPLEDKVGMGCLIDAQIPQLGAKRELANVLAARAMMRLGAGDRAGWREDVMTLQRYGRLLLQGQTLIQRLVGLAVDSVAQECAWAGLEGMGAEEARGMVGELRGLPAAPTLAESVDKVERLWPLCEMSAFAKYGMGLWGRTAAGRCRRWAGPWGKGFCR